jgi:hypothetical protein
MADGGSRLAYFSVPSSRVSVCGSQSCRQSTSEVCGIGYGKWPSLLLAHRCSPSASTLSWVPCRRRDTHGRSVTVDGADRTLTDREREVLDRAAASERVSQILSSVGYRVDELTDLAVVVESQETVDRDYDGSWFYAMR